MSDEPRGAGRPEHEPTARTRAQVQVMHAHGIPHRIIAKLVGCAPNTLRKHYREELRDAHLHVEAAMGAAIVAAARNGVWGAAKYWLLCNSDDPRWRKPEPHSLAGDPDAPPIRVELADMTDDDIRREIDDIAERQRTAAETRAVASSLPRRSNGLDH
jgi:hypothetical protein